MPSVRAFLSRAVWYPEAKAYLPAATDMNHLNALAGAQHGQTGSSAVWAQPVGWDKKRESRHQAIPTSPWAMTNWPSGRQLFHAWSALAGSRTLFITGKEWVGAMVRQPGGRIGVIFS